MTRVTAMPEQRWTAQFIVLLVAASLGAWGFGHSIELGITAEEMRYNPVHGMDWITAHNRLLAGEEAATRVAISCFAIAVFVAFRLFRSRSPRKTRFPPVVAGLGLTAAIVGALLVGLID